MKLIWYINIVFTIFLILVNSPKSKSFGDFGNQKQIVNITRGTQRRIQLITIINIFVFFILTIFFVLYSFI